MLFPLMNRDWKPNAPQLKRDFNQSPRPTSASRPASLGELKKLESERKPPAPQLNLNMRGGTTVAARSQADQQREIRIAQINQRLSQQRSRARDGFKRAR
jgi:hypothetical protein